MNIFFVLKDHIYIYASNYHFGLSYNNQHASQGYLIKRNRIWLSMTDINNIASCELISCCLIKFDIFQMRNICSGICKNKRKKFGHQVSLFASAWKPKCFATSIVLSFICLLTPKLLWKLQFWTLGKIKPTCQYLKFVRQEIFEARRSYV